MKHGGIDRILENLIHGERLTDRGMVVNLAILHDILAEQQDDVVLKRSHDLAVKIVDAINTYMCRPDLPDDTSCAIAVMCFGLLGCSSSLLDREILDSKRSIMVNTVSHILQHASLSPRKNAGERIETMEAWLLKKSNRLRRWNNRYFRLVPTDSEHGRVAMLSWTRKLPPGAGSEGERSRTQSPTKEKNDCPITHDTTVQWYVL